MDLLEFNNVFLTYFSDNGETLALKDVNFSVRAGEFVSIVGPSGCGKTTILSLISGLLKPTSGEILLNGKPIGSNKRAKDKSQNSESNFIGYMFQKDQLFEWRTVQKNIELGLEIRHEKTAENIEYATNLLRKYGLYEFRNKYPSQLSGGMRQRVALIRTLALKPKIMLLDEAFSALDYQTRLSVCDDISRILKDEGVTSILVTHDITEAIVMSNRVIVLTPRPASVKNIHTIELDDFDTPLHKRESEGAHAYFDSIWKELQYEEH